MELLIVTLVSTNSQRAVDVMARMHLIAETIRNAPGLLTSSIYRSRGNAAYFLILTTWDSEESWRLAYQRHDPKNLLLHSATELLTAAPEQWLMAYLWGYSRPAAVQVCAAAHLAHIRPEQAELAQQGWIEALRRQARYPLLSFAFLARGNHEHTTPPVDTPTTPLTEASEQAIRSGSVFLNLLCWATDDEREEFYTDTTYQSINRFVNTLGKVQVFTLEPL